MHLPNSKWSIKNFDAIVKISWPHPRHRFPSPRPGGDSCHQPATSRDWHLRLSRSRHHVHNLISSSKGSTPAPSLVLVPTARSFLGASVSPFWNYTDKPLYVWCWDVSTLDDRIPSISSWLARGAGFSATEKTQELFFHSSSLSAFIAQCLIGYMYPPIALHNPKRIQMSSHSYIPPRRKNVRGFTSK